MIVVSVQTFLVPTAMINLVASSLLNNIVGSTVMLTHDNNVVQELFRQQPCSSLSTSCEMFACAVGNLFFFFLNVNINTFIVVFS